MSADSDEALEVLREVWRGSGQRSVDLDDSTSGEVLQEDAGRRLR